MLVGGLEETAEAAAAAPAALQMLGQVEGIEAVQEKKCSSTLYCVLAGVQLLPSVRRMRGTTRHSETSDLPTGFDQGRI